MAAVGFDLYSRLLAEAVEERKADREDRAPVLVAPQAVVDLPLEAHLPDDYVPDEAQKLELYRRLARARTPGDIAAFRQEVIDRFGPMPLPVRAWPRSPSCGSRPRPRASRRCRARRASSSSASARACRGRRRCDC